MKKKDHKYSRRDFFKITGTAGIGSLLGSMQNDANAASASDSGTSDLQMIPSRPFG